MDIRRINRQLDTPFVAVLIENRSLRERYVQLLRTLTFPHAFRLRIVERAGLFVEEWERKISNLFSDVNLILVVVDDFNYTKQFHEHEGEISSCQMIVGEQKMYHGLSRNGFCPVIYIRYHQDDRPFDDGCIPQIKDVIRYVTIGEEYPEPVISHSIAEALEYYERGKALRSRNTKNLRS